MKRIVTVMLALVFVLPVFGVFTTSSAHAVDYKVTFGVCYNKSYSLANGRNATFVLPAHKSRPVQISTINSWTWKRAPNGQHLTSPAYNQYHVKFLDAKKRVVWSERKAIPNGGSRVFWVGSNVRYIVVSANAVYTSDYGAKYAWSVQPRVGFSSW